MDESVEREFATQIDYIELAKRQLDYGDPRNEASTYAAIAVAIELRRIAGALTNQSASALGI